MKERSHVGPLILLPTPDSIFGCTSVLFGAGAGVHLFIVLDYDETIISTAGCIRLTGLFRKRDDCQ
jgi:hypothetical protein